jgi:hypothetical protein
VSAQSGAAAGVTVLIHANTEPARKVDLVGVRNIWSWKWVVRTRLGSVCRKTTLSLRAFKGLSIEYKSMIPGSLLEKFVILSAKSLNLYETPYDADFSNM